MDDPWANAWGEPSKPTDSHVTPWPAPLVSSTPVPVNHHQDFEADIGIPSWATGASVQWAEPSDNQIPLWDTSLPAKGWDASPYDGIPLGEASPQELSQPVRSFSSESVERLSRPALPASPVSIIEPALLPDDDTNVSPPSPSPTTSSPVSAPGSPDAFGTFEVGLDVDADDADPWLPTAVSPVHAPADPDAWSQAWGGPHPEDDAHTDKKTLDVWEAAKKQREKQDRHIQPEVLASLIRQFQEFSNDIWPEINRGSVHETPSNDTDFRRDGRGSIDSIEGLAAAMDRLIPQDMILPPNVQFYKTFTSKHMGEALRLTRHAEMTRTSPMALYFASKGSTTWETSVKSRPEVLQDDHLPPGWRVIEKEKEDSSPGIDTKKKASGGLLSFFGRRGAASSPSEVGPRRSASPVRPPSGATTPATSAVNVSSNRASMNSATSSPPRSNTPAPISSPVGLSSTSLAAPPELAPAASFQQSLQQDTPESAAPTSAVSRFLTRFSRNKALASSPRNSLALSSDDLEFLSDIVPSANDTDDKSTQRRSLSSMIGVPPLPTKLPPPLAPPPRIISNHNVEFPSDHTTTADLLSLFDSPDSVGKAGLSFTQHTPPTALSVTSPGITPTMALPKTEVSRTGIPSRSSRTVPGPSRSHTPVSLKRTPVAIMSPPSSFTADSNSDFTFAPPPSSRTPLPIIPPPPDNGLSTSTLVSQSSPTLEQSSRITQVDVPVFESTTQEDFSDFSNWAAAPSTSINTSFSSAFSDESLVMNLSHASTSNSNDLFDDFDEFVSSPIRTPSPPRPPAKPPSFGHRPVQQRAQIPSRGTSPDKQPPLRPPRKVSRATDHQRTLSLVKTAAARSGTWPAPPSPLPEALPPPGAQPSFFDATSTVQDRQSKAIAGLASSVSSPAAFTISEISAPLAAFSLVPNPPVAPSPLPLSQIPPRLNLLRPKESVQPPDSNNAPISPASVTSGGLSAQDLSFFEAEADVRGIRDG